MSLAVHTRHHIPSHDLHDLGFSKSTHDSSGHARRTRRGWQRSDHINPVGLVQPGVQQLRAVVDGGLEVGGAVDEPASIERLLVKELEPGRQAALRPRIRLRLCHLGDWGNRTQREEGSRTYAPEDRRIRTDQRAHWCVNVPMAPCPVFLLRRRQLGSFASNMTGSAARLGGSPGPVFVFYPEHAEMLLARLNY